MAETKSYYTARSDVWPAQQKTNSLPSGREPKWFHKCKHTNLRVLGLFGWKNKSVVVFICSEEAITRWVFVFPPLFPFYLINGLRGSLRSRFMLVSCWETSERDGNLGWIVSCYHSMQSMCVFCVRLDCAWPRIENRFRLVDLLRLIKRSDAAEKGDAGKCHNQQLYSRLQAFLWLIGLLGSRENPSLQ